MDEERGGGSYGGAILRQFDPGRPAFEAHPSDDDRESVPAPKQAEYGLTAPESPETPSRGEPALAMPHDDGISESGHSEGPAADAEVPQAAPGALLAEDRPLAEADQLAEVGTEVFAPDDVDTPLVAVTDPLSGPLDPLTPDAPPASNRPGAAVVRPLPRIMAIANQKGGVGKTTTAVNLGAALAELGYRVLVIDLDPQGNATTGLGINARNLESSIYDVLLNDLNLEDCIEPTEVRNLFLAPATIDLAGAEIELVPAFSRELRLRRALERLGDEYDFTLIDCPPSLGLLTVNGLAAATEVVVPIQCEYYALEGLGQLLRNVDLVKRNLNPTLDLGAIILTMYDARTKLSDQVTKEVRQHFGPKVCRNIVPRTVRLSEAPSFGQPIIVFDPTSRGAIAYRELAKEVSGGAPRRAG